MVIGLFLATIALATPQFDQKTLGLMAASELLGKQETGGVTWLNRYHEKALPYFRTRPASDLRSELERVYRAHRFDSMEACGAAFVLALHGVEVDKNVARLARVHQFDEGASEVVEALPQAFADIALRCHDRSALVSLVDMESDGAIAEEQAFEVARVFRDDPVDVIKLAKNARRFRLLADQIGFGYERGDDAAFAKLAKTRYRDLAARLKRHLWKDTH